MGNIINWKGCAGKCGSYIYYRKTPFFVGWGKRGNAWGKQGGKGDGVENWHTG